MKVTLLASTKLNFPDDPFEWEGPLVDLTNELDYSINAESDADDLAEFAGRACYQSWNRPNPKTATNEGYLKNILDQKHESVLEHASATFYVEGVSRSLTHELIRHRHLSYSELSQRYVKMGDYHVVTPPAVGKLPQPHNVDAIDDMVDFEERAQDAYASLVEKLEATGIGRKQAREAARAVLPGGMETKIVVTGNMRAWRDTLKKRWHVAADAEIREFAGEILRQLRRIAPNSFQDIPEEPYV